MVLQTLNWPGILTAAVAAFIAGAIWYAPPVFGKAWQKALGLSDEQLASANMVKIFGLAFVLMLLSALAFATLLGPEPSIRTSLHWGLVTGIFFAATTLGIHNLFERKSLRFWLINAGYSIVTFVIYGLVLGLWP